MKVICDDGSKKILKAIQLILYYRLPRWDIPILLTFVVLAVLLTVVLVKCKAVIKHRVYSLILFFYSYNVLVTTLLMRGRNQDFMFNFVPFSEFYRLFSQPTNIESWEVVFNIVLFVPIGILLPCVLTKGNRFKRTMLVGFCSTLCIEFIQLVGRLGEFETDDVIANTLGVLIGYGIYSALRKLKSALHRKKTD